MNQHVTEFIRESPTRYGVGSNVPETARLTRLFSDVLTIRPWDQARLALQADGVPITPAVRSIWRAVQALVTSLNHTIVVPREGGGERWDAPPIESGEDIAYRYRVHICAAALQLRMAFDADNMRIINRFLDRHSADQQRRGGDWADVQARTKFFVKQIRAFANSQVCDEVINLDGDKLHLFPAIYLEQEGELRAKFFGQAIDITHYEMIPVCFAYLSYICGMTWMFVGVGENSEVLPWGLSQVNPDDPGREYLYFKPRDSVQRNQDNTAPCFVKDMFLVGALQFRALVTSHTDHVLAAIPNNLLDLRDALTRPAVLLLRGTLRLNRNNLRIFNFGPLPARVRDGILAEPALELWGQCPYGYWDGNNLHNLSDSCAHDGDSHTNPLLAATSLVFAPLLQNRIVAWNTRLSPKVVASTVPRTRERSDTFNQRENVLPDRWQAQAPGTSRTLAVMVSQYALAAARSVPRSFPTV